MKQPDRFERIVLMAMKANDKDGDHCIWLTGPEVVKLLRKEHNAVVRMVKENKKAATTYAVKDVYWVGYEEACNDILDQLAKQRT